MLDKFRKKLREWKKALDPTPSFEGKNKLRVVFQYNAHCEHCNTELERCIKKYSKGISSVALNKNLSLAVVEGVFDVGSLEEHIFQKVSKRVQVVSREIIGPVTESS